MSLSCEEDDRTVLVAKLLANVRDDSLTKESVNEYEASSYRVMKETKDSKRLFYIERLNYKPYSGRPANYQDICRILTNAHSTLDLQTTTTDKLLR